MAIFAHGYALPGVKTVEEANETFAQISGSSGMFALTEVTNGMTYRDWMNEAIETIRLPKGIYLKGGYVFPENFLSALSRKVGELLCLTYYENMAAYGCSYFLDGEKVLERITHAAGDVVDTDVHGKFKGQSTKDIIEGLFAQFTGIPLTVATKESGIMHRVQKRVKG